MNVSIQLLFNYWNVHEIGSGLCHVNRYGVKNWWLINHLTDLSVSSRAPILHGMMINGQPPKVNVHRSSPVGQNHRYGWGGVGPASEKTENPLSRKAGGCSHPTPLCPGQLYSGLLTKAPLMGVVGGGFFPPCRGKHMGPSCTHTIQRLSASSWVRKHSDYAFPPFVDGVWANPFTLEQRTEMLVPSAQTTSRKLMQI